MKRGDRYKEVLPLERLALSRVFIAGAGAVGRSLAVQLATMGVGKIVVCDKDDVEEANLGPQGWHENQIGKPKVEALAEVLMLLNSKLELVVHKEWFKPEQIADCQYVFSCVDNMEARKAILEAHVCPLNFKLYAEARMGAESCQASFVWDEPSRAVWLKDWFPQTDVVQEGCTAKSTHYCAAMAASLLVAGYTKSLRGIQLRPSVFFNIMADEFEAAQFLQQQEIGNLAKAATEAGAPIS